MQGTHSEIRSLSQNKMSTVKIENINIDELNLTYKNIYFVRNKKYISIKKRNNINGDNLAKFTLIYTNYYCYLFGVKNEYPRKKNFYSKIPSEIFSNLEELDSEKVRIKFGTTIDIRVEKAEDHLYKWFQFHDESNLLNICNYFDLYLE